MRRRRWVSVFCSTPRGLFGASDDLVTPTMARVIACYTANKKATGGGGQGRRRPVAFLRVCGMPGDINRLGSIATSNPTWSETGLVAIWFISEVSVHAPD